MSQIQLTNPLPNITAPLARVEITVNGKKIEGKAFLIPPWNSYFQQFVQQSPAALDITDLNVDYSSSLFDVTPNANGTIFVTGGTTVTLVLIRGNTSITLTSQSIIPIRIGDILRIGYITIPTIKFFPD